MSAARPTTAQELAPVRAALLRQAEIEATRLRAEAAADRDRRVAAARQRADAIRTEADQRGRADARAVADADLAAAGREARRVVLDAHRRAYEDLVHEVSERITVWLADPAVRKAFRKQVDDLLGAGAVVSTVPGGLIGTLGGRRVELSARALAGRAVRELGASVEELWKP